MEGLPVAKEGEIEEQKGLGNAIDGNTLNR